MELTREEFIIVCGQAVSYATQLDTIFETKPMLEKLWAHDAALRTRLAACEADKAKAEARVQALEQALQEIVQAGVKFDARGSHSEWVVLRSKLALEDAQHALEGRE